MTKTCDPIHPCPPRLRIAFATAALAHFPSLAAAAPLDVPNDFAAGQPISADAFNENFDEIEDAINDNDARLAELEDDIGIFGAVPAGAVVFFNRTLCPQGWTEMTGMRGRVPLGLPDGGLVAATVGTDLPDGGTRTITQVPLHAHTIDPPSTLSSTTGGHEHSVDPPNTGTTFHGGHDHAVDPPNTTASTGGSHTHTLTIENDDNYTTSYIRGAANASGGSNTSAPMSSAGSHDHTLDIGSFDSALGGNHVHSVDIGPFDSANAGEHTHKLDIAQFDSGATGVAGVDVTMPYLQLLACQKN